MCQCMREFGPDLEVHVGRASGGGVRWGLLVLGGATWSRGGVGRAGSAGVG